MATQRILVKISSSIGTTLSGTSVGQPGSFLLKLFDVLPQSTTNNVAGAGAGAGAGASQEAWYSIDIAPSEIGLAGTTNAWDIAYATARGGLTLAAGSHVVMAEPDFEQDAYPQDVTNLDHVSNKTHPVQQDLEAPYVGGRGFAWHLDDDHTGLRSARDSLKIEESDITIVHLDTGYDRNHISRPLHVVREHNFMRHEDPHRADDLTPEGGWFNNRGHGAGTISILAGRRLVGALPSDANGVTLGAAAPMKVVAVRIANSVVKFWTSSVAQGINLAVDVGADVVSMSMGGLPSAAWADAVNKAYDAGVVLVCAAGNNVRGFPTGLTVYPARFGRVIAADGIMANGAPYAALKTGKMEGNAGPRSKAATSLSAPTPNIPWAVCDSNNIIDLDGGGTSAATPQIAAAAALWLHKNGRNFEKGSWQRGEATRQALFRTARRSPEATPLLGNGSLQAREALEMKDPPDLRRQPEASAAFAFLHMLIGVFGVASVRSEAEASMLILEITQLALNSKRAQEAISDPDVPATELDDRQKKEFFRIIRDDLNCSTTLKTFLGQVVP